MQWIDAILIIWLVGSTISGFRLGFLYKATSLVATLIGLYFATKYTGQIASWFGAGIWTLIITFLILMSVVSHLAGLAAWGIDKLFSLAKWIPFVGIANRVAGACMSVLVSLIVLSVALWAAHTFSNGGAIAQQINNSAFASIITDFAVIALPLVAQSFQEYVRP